MRPWRMGRGQDRRPLVSGLSPPLPIPETFEVLETLAAGTEIELVRVRFDPASGRIDARPSTGLCSKSAGAVGRRMGFSPTSIPSPCSEDVVRADRSAGLGSVCGSVAVIDPLLLAAAGLKPPSEIRGDGGRHHRRPRRTIWRWAPNFGGPGLGLFGVRFYREKGPGGRPLPRPDAPSAKAKDISGGDLPGSGSCIHPLSSTSAG